MTIQESKHQITTAYEVHDRRPANMTLWTPALDRHIAMFDRPSDLVAGDRVFASAKNEEATVQRGVRRVIFPRRDARHRRDARMNGSDGSAADNAGAWAAKDASA